VAGRSLATVAEAVVPPLTVRRKLPLGTPVPVRGIRAGELASELVMVRVLLRGPRVVGVKVMVAVQLVFGASMVKLQGTVMA
jgi:hypothetical protein